MKTTTRTSSLSQLAAAILTAILVILPTVRSQCLTSNDFSTNVDNSASVHTLIDASTDFGLDMFELLVNESKNNFENVFFSPFSVWSALTMTYLGSNGNTEKELSEALNFVPVGKVGVARAYSSLKYWYLLRAISANNNFTINIANKIFFEESEKIRKCMLEYFGGELSNLNFFASPEESRKKINKWVEDQTFGKIRDMLPPGTITPESRMVLANAAYFKGKWQIQFEPSKTKKDVFFVTRDKRVNVDMMHVKGDFPSGNVAHLRSEVVELPYSGGELSMFVFLPDNGNVEDVAKQLNTSLLKTLSFELWETNMEVILPKFQLEQEFELAQVLQKLGINDLFDPYSADLSGFTGKKGMVAGSVRHKSFVDVNEEGSEAAAATAVITMRMARPLMPQVFSANRPFVFLIYDKKAESILFIGAMRSPNARSVQEVSSSKPLQQQRRNPTILKQ